jgi:hypothetical protein
MLRPTAKEVFILKDYKLQILFDNGETRIFDADYLLSKKPFLQLKSKSVFNTVHPNGISIEWANDIDICPDELYYNSKIYSTDS